MDGDGLHLESSAGRRPMSYHVFFYLGGCYGIENLSAIKFRVKVHASRRRADAEGIVAASSQPPTPALILAVQPPAASVADAVLITTADLVFPVRVCDKNKPVMGIAHCH